MSRYLAILLLLLSLQGIGQAGSSLDFFVTKTDSLRKLVEEHNLNDTTRVILLNNYALHCFYDHKYVDGLNALESSLKISTDLNYRIGEAEYYKTLGALHRGSKLELYYLKRHEIIKYGGIIDNWTGKALFAEGLNDTNIQKQLKSLQEAMDYYKKNADATALSHVSTLLYSYSKSNGTEEEKDKFWEEAQQIVGGSNQKYPLIYLLLEKIGAANTPEKRKSVRPLELHAIDLIEGIRDPYIKAVFLHEMGSEYFFSRRQPNIALEFYLKSHELAKTIESKRLQLNSLNILGATYWMMHDPSQALEFYSTANEIYEAILADGKPILAGTQDLYGYILQNTAMVYIELEDFETAKKYNESASSHCRKFPIWEYPGRYYINKGDILLGEGQDDEAVKYYKAAADTLKTGGFAVWAIEGIVNYYKEIGDYQTALDYALKAYSLEGGWDYQVNETSLQLAEVYEKMGNFDKSTEYLMLHTATQKLKRIEWESKQIEEAELKLILDQKKKEVTDLEKEKAEEEYQSKIRTNTLLGSSFTLLVVAFLLWRSRSQKQKSKLKIEEAYVRLQNTQSQLIHSEKMASLGELTAGIAHEIQNPLNFVNNFSEVNKELIEDLKEAISQNDQEEVETLLADLLDNEDKVVHHGKRAEQIVKSMLQHSRGSEGEKEPTDINALCDEYLRLAYHGFRAKDKSFNAEFELDLDETLHKVKVVPQDIGRVLLNLINNAFQAVANSDNPKVTVKTKLIPPYERGTKGVVPPLRGGQGEVKEGVRGVLITVTDNGPGIPKDIREKIFQPFFTTKPTGQGTGLGLSMSYDIVTKGHQGKLELDNRDGDGSTFFIILPT